MRTSNSTIFAPLSKEEAGKNINVDFLVSLGYGWVWVDDD
jgi:hypothetical protein